MDRFEPAMRFFRRCLGDDWEAKASPQRVTGQGVTELLWPLNAVFRRRLAELERLKYEARFESAADSAIDDIAAAMDLDTIDAAPAGVVRVLLERHRQMLVVAMANEKAGNPVTTLPSGLSREQQTVAVMLTLLRGMTLPWPPGGPTSGKAR